MQDQHTYARHCWDYAISVCTRTLPDGSAEKVALLNAEQDPSPLTIRAALAVAVGKPWRPLFEGALIELGIAAAGDILGGDDHE